MSGSTIEPRTVTGAPELAALVAGPAGAPAIVFVHGIALSKQAFAPVLAGPLAARYRLIAFDLRGHGDAQLPGADLSRAQLADDLARVIDQLAPDRPVIAPWSFGGVALGEYLRRHGDARLGGIVSLAASVRTGRDAGHLFGAGMMTHARPLLAQEPEAYAAAARAFVADTTAAPIDAALRDAMVAEMLRVPAHVRRPLLAGGEDYTPALAATRVPIAAIHGALDDVVLPAMSEVLREARPDLDVRTLAGVAHVPWLEAPAAFAATLADLVDPWFSDRGTTSVPRV